jgi:hypothetical protein
MRICSIDIGKVNFAYCITEYTSIYPNGNILLLENVNISSDIKPKHLLFPVFKNMTNELDKHKDLLDTCDYVVIEKQMNTNIMALKLGQHCQSYFMLKVKTNLVEFPSYYKTQCLNAPLKMTYSQRKKWAVHKAIDILMERGDYVNLTLLTLSTKSDDLADVIVQTEAFLLKKDKVFILKTN